MNAVNKLDLASVEKMWSGLLEIERRFDQARVSMAAIASDMAHVTASMAAGPQPPAQDALEGYVCLSDHYRRLGRGAVELERLIDVQKQSEWFKCYWIVAKIKALQSRARAHAKRMARIEGDDDWDKSVEQLVRMNAEVEHLCEVAELNGLPLSVRSVAVPRRKRREVECRDDAGLIPCHPAPVTERQTMWPMGGRTQGAVAEPYELPITEVDNVPRSTAPVIERQIDAEARAFVSWGYRCLGRKSFGGRRYEGYARGNA